MRGFELVAGVIGIFFAIGIAVGVLIVIALPQIREYRRLRRSISAGGRQKSSGLGDQSGPPRWPGRRG